MKKTAAISFVTITGTDGGGIHIDSYLVNIHGSRIFRLVYTPISTPFQ
jgi:hypothetical protein